MINLLKHCALTYFAKNLRWEDTPTRVFSDDNKVSINKERGYDVSLELCDDDEKHPFTLVPNKSDPNGLIRAEKWNGKATTEEYIYISTLNSARISVSYSLNGSRYSAENCSVLKLIQMVLLKKIGLMYFFLLYAKLLEYFRSRKISQKLRMANALSKYEVYRLIMSCESWKRSGGFTSRDLAKELLNIRFIPMDEMYRVTSQASQIELILEACSADGEMVKRADLRYTVTGKGLNSFTTTREFIKTEEHSRKIQSRMARYTSVLAVVTFALCVGEFKCELSEVEWVKSITPTAVELVAKQCKP